MIVFTIIGILAVLLWIPKMVAVLIIPLINKSKGLKKLDEEAYLWLQSNRCFDRNVDNDWYIIPTISFHKGAIYFEVVISWLKWSYYINYSYSSES